MKISILEKPYFSIIRITIRSSWNIWNRYGQQEAAYTDPNDRLMESFERQLRNYTFVTLLPIQWNHEHGEIHGFNGLIVTYCFRCQVCFLLTFESIREQRQLLSKHQSPLFSIFPNDSFFRECFAWLVSSLKEWREIISLFSNPNC